MSNIIGTALSVSVGFFILGVVWAAVDKRWGGSVRRWWHGMTNKDPLPDSDTRGFIVGRKFTRKWTVALVISTVQSFYVLFVSPESLNLLIELILWALEVGVMVIGFYMLKPLQMIAGIFSKNVAPTIDRLESGEATVTGMASTMAAGVTGKADKVVRNAVDHVSGAAENLVERVGDILPEDAEQVVEQPSEPEELPITPDEKPIKKIDHRAELDKFNSRI